MKERPKHQFTSAGSIERSSPSITDSRASGNIGRLARKMEHIRELSFLAQNKTRQSLPLQEENQPEFARNRFSMPDLLSKKNRVNQGNHEQQNGDETETDGRVFINVKHKLRNSMNQISTRSIVPATHKRPLENVSASIGSAEHAFIKESAVFEQMITMGASDKGSNFEVGSADRITLSNKYGPSKKKKRSQVTVQLRSPELHSRQMNMPTLTETKIVESPVTVVENPYDNNNGADRDVSTGQVILRQNSVHHSDTTLLAITEQKSQSPLKSKVTQGSERKSRLQESENRQIRLQNYDQLLNAASIVGGTQTEVLSPKIKKENSLKGFASKARTSIDSQPQLLHQIVSGQRETVIAQIGSKAERIMAIYRDRKHRTDKVQQIKLRKPSSIEKEYKESKVRQTFAQILETQKQIEKTINRVTSIDVNDNQGGGGAMISPSELFRKKQNIQEKRNLSQSISTKTLMRNFPANRRFRNQLASVQSEKQFEEKAQYLRALQDLTQEAEFFAEQERAEQVQSSRLESRQFNHSLQDKLNRGKSRQTHVSQTIQYNAKSVDAGTNVALSRAAPDQRTEDKGEVQGRYEQYVAELRSLDIAQKKKPTQEEWKQEKQKFHNQYVRIGDQHTLEYPALNLSSTTSNDGENSPVKKKTTEVLCTCAAQQRVWNQKSNRIRSRKLRESLDDIVKIDSPRFMQQEGERQLEHIRSSLSSQHLPLLPVIIPSTSDGRDEHQLELANLNANSGKKKTAEDGSCKVGGHGRNQSTILNLLPDSSKLKLAMSSPRPFERQSKQLQRTLEPSQGERLRQSRKHYNLRNHRDSLAQMTVYEPLQDDSNHENYKQTTTSIPLVENNNRLMNTVDTLVTSSERKPAEALPAEALPGPVCVKVSPQKSGGVIVVQRNQKKHLGSTNESEESSAISTTEEQQKGNENDQKVNQNKMEDDHIKILIDQVHDNFEKTERLKNHLAHLNSSSTKLKQIQVKVQQAQQQQLASSSPYSVGRHQKKEEQPRSQLQLLQQFQESNSGIPTPIQNSSNYDNLPRTLQASQQQSHHQRSQEMRRSKGTLNEDLGGSSTGIFFVKQHPPRDHSYDSTQQSQNRRSESLASRNSNKSKQNKNCRHTYNSRQRRQQQQQQSCTCDNDERVESGLIQKVHPSRSPTNQHDPTIVNSTIKKVSEGGNMALRKPMAVLVSNNQQRMNKRNGQQSSALNKLRVIAQGQAQQRQKEPVDEPTSGVVRQQSSDYIQGKKKRFTLVMKQTRFSNSKLPSLYQAREQKAPAMELMVRGESSAAQQVVNGISPVAYLKESRRRQKGFLNQQNMPRNGSKTNMMTTDQLQSSLPFMNNTNNSRTRQNNKFISEGESQSFHVQRHKWPKPEERLDSFQTDSYQEGRSPMQPKGMLPYQNITSSQSLKEMITKPIKDPASVNVFQNCYKIPEEIQSQPLSQSQAYSQSQSVANLDSHNIGTLLRQTKATNFSLESSDPHRIGPARLSSDQQIGSKMGSDTTGSKTSKINICIRPHDSGQPSLQTITPVTEVVANQKSPVITHVANSSTTPYQTNETQKVAAQALVSKQNLNPSGDIEQSTSYYENRVPQLRQRKFAELKSPAYSSSKETRKSLQMHLNGSSSAKAYLKNVILPTKTHQFGKNTSNKSRSQTKSQENIDKGISKPTSSGATIKDINSQSTTKKMHEKNLIALNQDFAEVIDQSKHEEGKVVQYKDESKAQVIIQQSSESLSQLQIRFTPNNLGYGAPILGSNRKKMQTKQPTRTATISNKLQQASQGVTPQSWSNEQDDQPDAKNYFSEIKVQIAGMGEIAEAQEIAQDTPLLKQNTISLKPSVSLKVNQMKLQVTPTMMRLNSSDRSPTGQNTEQLDPTSRSMVKNTKLSEGKVLIRSQHAVLSEMGASRPSSPQHIAYDGYGHDAGQVDVGGMRLSASALQIHSTPQLKAEKSITGNAEQQMYSKKDSH